MAFTLIPQLSFWIVQASWLAATIRRIVSLFLFFPAFKLANFATLQGKCYVHFAANHNCVYVLV